jgi:hypothetical protein
MPLIIVFLGGHSDMSFGVVDKKQPAVVLKFLGKRFISLQKLVYLYQAEFLKEVRMDQYCKVKVNVLEKLFLSRITMRLLPIKVM